MIQAVNIHWQIINHQLTGTVILKKTDLIEWQALYNKIITPEAVDVDRHTVLYPFYF